MKLLIKFYIIQRIFKLKNHNHSCNKIEEKILLSELNFVVTYCHLKKRFSLFTQNKNQ